MSKFSRWLVLVTLLALSLPTGPHAAAEGAKRSPHRASPCSASHPANFQITDFVNFDSSKVGAGRAHLKLKSTDDPREPYIKGKFTTTCTFRGTESKLRTLGTGDDNAVVATLLVPEKRISVKVEPGLLSKGNSTLEILSRRSDLHLSFLLTVRVNAGGVGPAAIALGIGVALLALVAFAHAMSDNDWNWKKAAPGAFARIGTGVVAGVAIILRTTSAGDWFASSGQVFDLCVATVGAMLGLSTLTSAGVKAARHRSTVRRERAA
jgi:hypothetical protein